MKPIDALLLVLDHVDYTNNACSPTEMVGAVLPKSVIQIARDCVTTEQLMQALREIREAVTTPFSPTPIPLAKAIKPRKLKRRKK